MRSQILVTVLLSATASGQSTTATIPVSAPSKSAIPAPPQADPKLPEPIPLPTQPDGTRYLNNPNLLVFCTSQLATFNGRDADMIFIGDSITQGWLGVGRAVWDAEFASRKALDFGISGDQTQHVLWRMNNYPIQRLHPKVAVILIGTNNGHNTPPEIAAGVEAVIEKTKSLYPGIKIIVTSIMPNGRANAQMMEADAIIKTYTDGQNVFYLDMIPLMPPVGDNWKGLSAGRLHPDESGYRIWADALLPLVNRFLPAPAGAGQRSIQER